MAEQEKCKDQREVRQSSRYKKRIRSIGMHFQTIDQQKQEQRKEK
jgi:hypothetical protein